VRSRRPEADRDENRAVFECRALGPWSIRINGAAAPAQLRWKKHFGLLVYLARSPKQTRTRDHLIGLLWADKPEGKARRSLNVALSLLRRNAGEGSLSTDGDQVRLSPGVVAFDVDRFDSLATAGDLASAAALIHGEFLQGFSISGCSEFEDWLYAERASVRGRSLDVLTRLANAALDAGNTGEAERLADRARGLDRLFEPAVQTAMRARALAGDRAGALSCYKHFKARLAKEVGTAPSVETETLAQLVSRERAGPKPKLKLGDKTVPPGGVPLEDRGEKLERVVAVWRTCQRERRRSLIFIEGDPGMGKTRLAEEVMARARLDGAVVAAIRAVEADVTSPWSGVYSLCGDNLLTAPGATGASPAAVATLRVEPSASSSMAKALSELVAAVCDERPLVLVLDDVQWLDRESLLAILALLRDPPAPLTIVVTALSHPARPELDDVRARLGRDVAGAAVHVDALSTAAIARLARWALPRADDKQVERVTRRVTADTAGIPLLVTALLQAVAAGLDPRVGKVKEGWPTPGKTLHDTLPGDLPDSIVGAVRVMFWRAGEDARRVLIAAAVLGKRSAATRLGRGAELEGKRLMAALDELEWLRWLAAEPRGYDFVARIFRDVVNRDMVKKGQRQRILQTISG
jgi:DNA-binding SARP family transcriptional activator